jgi:hypothetical protein
MSNGDLERLRSQQFALARALTQPSTGFSNQEPSLSSLDPQEIARSAETLIRKRLSQTRSALRGTSKLLGDEFAKEFREFASTHFFSGPDAIWKDAIEFSRWLARRHKEPEWLLDLLRWEYERCCWESQRFCFSLFRLRYRVVEWIDGLSDNARIEPPLRSKQWVLIWRLGHRGGIRAIPRR